MELLQIIILALVQGLTEFLPVSSSAHLILVPMLTDWQDQGLSFDIAVHVGTLMAVVSYFRVELFNMSKAWCVSITGGVKTQDSHLAWAVIMGTVPVGLAGLLGKGFIETYLRSPLVIAIATIVFGLLLWLAYVNGARHRDEYSLSWADILLIGCAQILALIPGTSRSGITITAGLFRGLTAEAAARFSFLLSIPVITLAGLLQAVDLFGQPDQVVWQSLIWGAVLSAFSAYICIHFFLRLLSRIGMLPFVVYRLLLGLVLLFLFI